MAQLGSAPTTTFPGRVGRSPRNLAKSVVGLVGRVALLFGRFLVGRWSVFGRVGSVFLQTNYDSLLVFYKNYTRVVEKMRSFPTENRPTRP